MELCSRNKRQTLLQWRWAHLPEFGADLIAALSNLHRNDLAHVACWRRRVDGDWSPRWRRLWPGQFDQEPRAKTIHPPVFITCRCSFNPRPSNRLVKCIRARKMRRLLASALLVVHVRPCDALALHPRAVGGWVGDARRCLAPRLQSGECMADAEEPKLELAQPEDPLGSLPPVGNLMEPLKPHLISVVEQDPHLLTLPPTEFAGDKFVELFRSCAPYIKMHQGRTVRIFHHSSEERHLVFNWPPSLSSFNLFQVEATPSTRPRTTFLGLTAHLPLG